MIDSILIEKVYQPISDKVMDWTHRSCFWLAAQAHVASLVLFAVLVAWNRFDPFGSAILVWSCFITRSKWKEAASEDRRFWNGATALPPPNLAYVLSRRIVLLVAVFLAVLNLIEFVEGTLQLVLLSGTGWAVCLFSFYCFMACRPKPPRRQRQTVRGPLAFEGST